MTIVLLFQASQAFQLDHSRLKKVLGPIAQETEIQSIASEIADLSIEQIAELGAAYLYGKKFEQRAIYRDEARGYKISLVAAEYGNSKAQSIVGSTLYWQKRYIDALKWFDLSAQTGNARSHYFLGLMHLDGSGVQPNLTLAIHYLKSAADAGHNFAPGKLAELYLEGDRVTRDCERALAYARLGITRDDSHAKAILGYMYFHDLCFTHKRFYDGGLKGLELRIVDPLFQGVEFNLAPQPKSESLASTLDQFNKYTDYVQTYTVLAEQPSITSDDITSVKVVPAIRSGVFWLEITLLPEARKTLFTITSQHVGDSMAILVNGEVLMMPRIMGAVDSESFMIRGTWTQADAERLASLFTGHDPSDGHED